MNAAERASDVASAAEKFRSSIVTRRNGGSLPGVPASARVFVVGPAEDGTYGATTNVAEASRFGRAQAAYLVLSKWRGLAARVESVPEPEEARDVA